MNRCSSTRASTTAVRLASERTIDVTAWRTLTPDKKSALYASRKRYAADLKKLAFNVYSNRCSCGSTHNLKLRFHDLDHPDKRRFTKHHLTLHLAILRDAEFARQVGLYCTGCRIAKSYVSHDQDINPRPPQTESMSIVRHEITEAE
jgi:hypothetical protein